MKYLAAIPVILLLFLFDVFLIVSIVGLLALLEMRDYPTCRAFAEKVWGL